MSIFATESSNSLSFVVQNITVPPGRVIKVFNTQIYPNNTLDLMQIPGISEEDIRASLIKGDLKNKIINRQLRVIKSPEIITATLGNDLLNILGPATTIRPVPVVPAIVKTLTNGVPLSIFQVDLSATIPQYSSFPDYSFGAKIFFSIEASDGYDVQLREGDVNVAAVMRVATAGPITTAQAVNATNAVTAGTLVVTFSWATSGTIATLQVTATSSLVPTQLELHYFLLHATHRTPAFSFL